MSKNRRNVVPMHKPMDKAEVAGRALGMMKAGKTEYQAVERLVTAGVDRMVAKSECRRVYGAGRPDKRSDGRRKPEPHEGIQQYVTRANRARLYTAIRVLLQAGGGSWEEPTLGRFLDVLRSVRNHSQDPFPNFRNIPVPKRVSELCLPDDHRLFGRVLKYICNGGDQLGNSRIVLVRGPRSKVCITGSDIEDGDKDRDIARPSVVRRAEPYVPWYPEHTRSGGVYCVTCKHAAAANMPFENVSEAVCRHPQADVSLVTGLALCRDMRALTGKCGPQGVLHEGE